MFQKISYPFEKIVNVCLLLQKFTENIFLYNVLNQDFGYSSVPLPNLQMKSYGVYSSLLSQGEI